MEKDMVPKSGWSELRMERRGSCNNRWPPIFKEGGKEEKNGLDHDHRRSSCLEKWWICERQHGLFMRVIRRRDWQIKDRSLSEREEGWPKKMEEGCQRWWRRVGWREGGWSGRVGRRMGFEWGRGRNLRPVYMEKLWVSST